MFATCEVCEADIYYLSDGVNTEGVSRCLSCKRLGHCPDCVNVPGRLCVLCKTSPPKHANSRNSTQMPSPVGGTEDKKVREQVM